MLIELGEILVKYQISDRYVAHFGAHHGQEVESYIEHNFKEIHLFEPQSCAFDFLEQKFRKTKIISLYNFALGSKSGSSLLNLGSGDGQSSSILEPQMHRDLYPYIDFNDSEKIEVKRFDDLELPKVNFLNIDIQGFELEALKGCENQLKKSIEYIYTEVNRKHVYKDCALIHEIDEYLNHFGFIRVETKWWNFFTPWGDAFYIKGKKLSRFWKLKVKMRRILLSEFFLFAFYDFNSNLYNFYNFVINKFQNLKNRILPS